MTCSQFDFQTGTCTAVDKDFDFNIVLQFEDEADDNNYPSFSFSIMLTLAATDYVQIYAEVDDSADKDYKIMSGTSLEIFKLS